MNESYIKYIFNVSRDCQSELLLLIEIHPGSLLLRVQSEAICDDLCVIFRIRVVILALLSEESLPKAGTVIFLIPERPRELIPLLIFLQLH